MQMGSLSTQLPPCSSTAPATADDDADPQWMLLAPYGGGIEDRCNIIGDPNTIAATASSTGQRIIVSLRREPPPALSRICICYLPGPARNRQAAYSTVIAAHGGSVLLQIYSNEGYPRPCTSHYFVYSNVAVAGGPARPPSFYMLPRRWRLDTCATGLLCHGKAGFVGAALKILRSKDDAAVAAASTAAFELHLFRHSEWSVTRPRIISGEDDGSLLDLDRWEPQAVVPLGDRLLCWIIGWRYCCRLRCVMLSDVLDECPMLRYVPCPAEVMKSWCFLCTNARGAVKLVGLSPWHCSSHCSCSQHATAVNTWMLVADDMAWVLETTKINMVDDSTEVWALDTLVQAGYARVHLVYPVASVSGGGHVASDESAAPTGEEDEHT